MSDAPALFMRHEGLAGLVAARFYLPGADRDDVVQEARIALWEACRCFNPRKGASFKTFAELVIRRRLIDKIDQANQERHLVLTHRADGTVAGDDGDQLDLFDAIPDPRADVAARLELREELDRVIAGFDRLSETERRAMIRVLDGPHDRARLTKSDDNAVQRARRKLREAA